MQSASVVQLLVESNAVLLLTFTGLENGQGRNIYLDVQKHLAVLQYVRVVINSSFKAPPY